MEHWAYWINEPIFIDKGLQYEKRKHAIYRFCRDGLIPLIESAGYRFEYKDSKFYHAFLSMLHLVATGHTVKPVTVEIPNQEEQYSEFHSRLDSEVWQEFWTEWGFLQDFEEDAYGHRFHYELAEFVWSWLDFEKSPAVESLYLKLEAEDSYEEGPKGKDDPYLQETSKRDYQDRHW